MTESVDSIEERFRANLNRVTKLVELFKEHASGRGRAAVAETDVLRAAVVLLHAALEDLLRSIEEILLPTMPPETFDGWKLSLPSTPRSQKERFTLKELLEFREKTVDEVLVLAIQQYLAHSNYNSFGELAAAVKRVGLNVTPLRPHQPDLDAMMQRRHWIAHRADRNVRAGRGQHAAQHLADSTVAKWAKAVEDAGFTLLQQLRMGV
ncbi:MAG: hypothetical protein RBU37_24740 [Myxococcota bacterium]|nr:hypothetical protein [Myxococcota bacterium]